MILFFLILFGLLSLGMYPIATLLGWVIGYSYVAIKHRMRGLPLPSFFPPIPFDQFFLLLCGALLDGVIFWILYECHVILVALKVTAVFWTVIIFMSGVIWSLRGLARKVSRYGADKRSELSL